MLLILFLLGIQDLHNHPFYGVFLGRLAVRILGVNPEFLAPLHTEEEAARAVRMSFEEMAAEALGLKYT